jgi:hypothetical protein
MVVVEVVKVNYSLLPPVIGVAVVVTAVEVAAVPVVDVYCLGCS